MFDRWFSKVLFVFTWVAGAVLILMTVSINYEVIMRYFLNRPTTWVTEYSEFAIMYLTFFTGAWVMSKGGHVRIELLLERLPTGFQFILNVVTSIVAALFWLLFFWYSVQLIQEAIELKQMLVGGTVFPKWPVLLPMPIGSFFLALQLFRQAWLNAKQRKVIVENAPELKRV